METLCTCLQAYQETYRSRCETQSMPRRSTSPAQQSPLAVTSHPDWTIRHRQAAADERHSLSLVSCEVRRYHRSHAVMALATLLAEFLLCALFVNAQAVSLDRHARITHDTVLPGAQYSMQAMKAPAARAAPAGLTAKVDSSMSDLIRRLPKAELHIHIEGTIEPELMWSLAQRNSVKLPYPDIAAAKAARENYSNLQDFLDVFHVGQSVLLTQEDFHDVTEAYLNKAAAQNITHVELFFDAQEHVARGVSLSAVISGMQSAILAREHHPTHPIKTQLILCLQRDRGQAAAAGILARSLPYLKNISGLGLASAEVGYPPELFKNVYRAASILGLHKVAHAGEEGGPEYVWSSLRVLGVERIDHGIRSLEDPQLVQYLADHKVPITLCPISNLKLQVCKGSLVDKIREVLASGILVTLNSDDPAYFQSYLNANYEYVAAVTDLSAGEIAALAKNSFAASFIPKEEKRAAYARINQVLAAWTAEQQQQQQRHSGSLNEKKGSSNMINQS